MVANSGYIGFRLRDGVHAGAGPGGRWRGRCSRRRAAGGARWASFWNSEQTAAPAARRPWGWPQLLTGIIFVIVSLLAVAAVQQAPNPGYASSVVSTSALLVALASPLLFPSASLTSAAFAGLLLVVAGITVVSLSAH